MLSVEYLVTRLVGPFFAGVFLAGVASSHQPVSYLTLFALAMVSGWISLPGTYRRMGRLLERFV